MAHEKHLPSVIWAQRNDRLYVTINVEDCSDAVIKFEEQKLLFSGQGGPDKVHYEITMEFYGKINPSESKYALLSRHIPMVIRKSEDGPYWPRLLQTTSKVHWLKTDFGKWRDEDDSDVDESKDVAFEDMMHKMGKFNTSDNDNDGGVKNEEDSDDEDLPDLE